MTDLPLEKLRRKLMEVMADVTKHGASYRITRFGESTGAYLVSADRLTSHPERRLPKEPE